MKININQRDFLEGIQIVNRAVSNKSTLPILKGVYLETVKDKGLKLIGNNLEIGIEYFTNAEIIEEGSIVLPAIKLSNIIRELPSGADISFLVDNDLCQAEISCLNSEFTLKGYQADEFPQLPELENALKIELDDLNFKKMIEEVKFSTSTDQTQPTLTGGLFEIDKDIISLVTTNTYRLAYSQMNIEKDLEEEYKVILPGTTLNELHHLIGNDIEKIEIFINNSYVRFNYRDIIFISRLIEGKFPNYRQVLPDNFKSIVKVDRIGLLNAVRRVSLIARLDSNVISLKIDRDRMSIDSSSSEYGKAHEIIEVELEGPEQSIDIDADYIIDVLKVLEDETVKLLLNGPLNALSVKKESDDNYIYLIMPVRPGS